MLREGLALLEDRPPSTTSAFIHGEYAINLMLDGMSEDAIRHATLELDIGRQIGAEWLCADALITIGSIRGVDGEREGLGQIEEGLDLARRLNHGTVVVRGYKNLQSLVAVHAELERARTVAEEGRVVATRFGDTFHVGWFDVELAWLECLRGDWDAALQHVRAFVDGLGERDHYMETPAHLLLGRIKAERGEPEEGVRESVRGLELARAARDHQVVLPALVTHACVLVRVGRAAEAHPLLDEFIAVADRGDAAFADAALALDLLGRSEDFGRIAADIRDSPWGPAAEAFARGDYSAAADRYREAGDELHEAESRLRLARSGDAVDPEAEARAAAAFFRRAGAGPRIAEAEAVVRATASRSA